MKGILLAGGSGSRLYPTTLATSKQLLPIFDKPMIYYPLSTLMLAGIREILLITAPQDEARFKALLGDGSSLGLEICYQVQKSPLGIAHAILLAEPFIAQEPVALILGDNLFYGSLLPSVLKTASQLTKGALIFAYQVHHPDRYGVVRFTENGEVLGIEEKPSTFYSSFAIPGLYFYDERAVGLVKQLSFSERGELEITDLHKKYLETGTLSCRHLDKGFVWLDTGTPSSLIDASSFVKTMQERQGIMIGAVEEVAYQMGYIDEDTLVEKAKSYPNAYGEYLRSLLKMSSI